MNNVLCRSLIVAVVLITAALSFSSRLIAAAPTPDLESYSYGANERNVLDLWKAKSDAPTPLLVYFHGGGFDHGDKTNLSGRLLKSMLEAGISVMAANYRLTPQAKYPEHYLDCARAIQTARHNSKDWNIDPIRVAATGTSAGGVISLWLACHDDLADPDNADQVLRESTRLRCVALVSTPVSLDPREIREWIGEKPLQHRFFRGAFFGLTPEEANSPEGLKLFAEASPLTYLTANDPPVFAFYYGPKELSEDLTVSDSVHHYAFGVELRKRLNEKSVECKLVHISDVKDGDSGMVGFLRRHLFADERTD